MTFTFNQSVAPIGGNVSIPRCCIAGFFFRGSRVHDTGLSIFLP